MVEISIRLNRKMAAYLVEMVVMKQSIQLRRYAIMSKHNVVESTGREKVRDQLTELILDVACSLKVKRLRA